MMNQNTAINNRPARLSALMMVAMLIGASVLAVPQPAEAARNKSWKVIKRKSGVVVKKRYIKGYTLPVIRGEATVNANIYQILAVINDVGRSCKWMADCKETKILKRRSDFDLVVYNRTGAPWPLDDRDVVVQTNVKVSPKSKQVLVEFYSIKYGARNKNYVRMPILKGKYILTKLGDNRTHLVYQAQANVGGNVPDWIAEIKSESIPYDTIVALRKRVYKTRKTTTYASFIKQWDPRQGGKGF